MPEMISAKQLRGRLQDVVKKVRQGERFTVLYRSRPAFDIVPVGNPSLDSTPLESDPLYQAPAVGASESGDAATRHDEVLYR
ncbi:MAG: type II toxin-antitoxin system prevent-host-death family antitoxin [Desulfurellaceae bacterium]|nr:type II toxin-antitoxin system prevent-host-death family antitoxin [Desulfurellaceae bacterium]